MSRMMCTLKYGCFTDYFLEEETVINILEHVGEYRCRRQAGAP